MAGLVALGLALRLYHYGRNPAMWHDEAHTVTNILQRNFGELFGALSTAATGPPLFLCLEKLVTLVLGDGTYALRLPSLLASCVGLLVLAHVASRTLSSAGSFAAILIVACSDRLLWHASEARHYSTDFLIATLLLGFLLETKSWPARRRAWLLAALVPIIIFSSYPGVFLCGGAFAALVPELLRERRWRDGLILGAALACSFAAFYFITVRPQHTAEMSFTWLRTFPDWQRPWTVPGWAVRSTIGVFDYIARPLGGLLLLPAVVGGIAAWRNQRREVAIFALVPMLLAMLAALVQSYPYTGARTMIFAMPTLVLLIGGGIDAALAWPPNHALVRRLALFLIAVSLAAIFSLAGYRVVVVWPRAATDQASAYVLAHRAPDEPVTANHWEYEYYFRGLGSEFVPELRLLAQPAPPPRVWIVVTAGNLAARDELIAAAQPRWRILERHDFHDTSVLLATPAHP
ncbi:MAG: hypothetical protein ACR2NX_01040 [Chthoniobacterales bacterium]